MSDPAPEADLAAGRIAERENEERLRLALDAGRLGTWDFDPVAGALAWDDRCRELFGLGPSAEVDYDTFLRGLHPDDRGWVDEAVRSALDPDGPGEYDVEYRVVGIEDGVARWIAARGRTLFDAERLARRFIGTVADITARKKAEAENAALLDALALERERLEDETRALEIINRVGSALAGELEQERLVQMLTDEATELAGAQFGAYFYNVVNRAGESYMLYALSGVPREAFARFPMPRNTAIFGPTFNGEAIVRLDDVTADPRYGRNAPYHGMPEGHLPVRSYLAVPVVSRSGEVLGGLFFGHSETGVFTERAERLVSAVAAQAAVALDNARLLDETRRAEAELKKGERRLRIAVDAADLGMWEWDLETEAVTWSERTARLFGFGAGEFDGTYDAVAARIHPADRARAEEGVRRAIGDGSVYEDEFRILLDGGAVRWIAARGQIFGADGEARRMAGVCMDVTERRRTEELRAEAFAREQQARIQLEAASRAKDEFLAVVSHELRTPLNSILGWARLLRNGKLDDETVARAIETIERNVKSQAQLIEDLLDVSRIISGKLRVNTQPLAPATFVEAALDIVRPAAEAKEIAVSLERPTSLPLVLGDPERLQQVVWNLVSNAVKFTPKGGRVEVRLAKVDSSVEVAVADTGQGIAADFLPYVFDPFRQADSAATRVHKGLGLGLAIVRHLVELHGGSIAAESAGEGLGAAFRVRLPVAAVRSSAPGRDAAAARNAAEFEHLRVLAGLRVLVVDDEPDTRDVLALSLERAGATVVAAASAAEARAALDAGAFDVLVSDIGMPEEDGYDLIRSIRARPVAEGGLVPAIALTAFSRAEDRVHALAAGFEMHVAKPVEPLELEMTIKNLTSLAGRSSGP